jgi:histidyl-tRNA synthetase
MRFKALRGFRDFSPEDMAFRRWTEAAWHRASRSSGFEEFDGPILEPLDLFTTKSGEEIVSQLYVFSDKSDTQVALRPEMTPTLARMVGTRVRGMAKPIKWYCIQQSFRYERPQRGRGREFFCWNVDVLGADEPAADAEVMAVALDALRILGLGQEDVVLRLNDRRFLGRMLASIEVTEAEMGGVLGWIDKLEREPTARDRLEERLGRKRAGELLRWCDEMPLEQAEELAPVLDACRDYGIDAYLEPDFKIVRGLAYYTGPVWEVFDRGRKLRAVAGGGRYDGLVAALGGPDLSAVGFGMGDVVLADLLRDRGLGPGPSPRAEAYVVPIGAEMLGPARRVVRLLRERGVATDSPYGPAKVAKALRAASLAGARRAILVGPDEWAEESVRVKDLDSGEEQKIRLADLS